VHKNTALSTQGMTVYTLFALISRGPYSLITLTNYFITDTIDREEDTGYNYFGMYGMDSRELASAMIDGKGIVVGIRGMRGDRLVVEMAGCSSPNDVTYSEDGVLTSSLFQVDGAKRALLVYQPRRGGLKTMSLSPKECKIDTVDNGFKLKDEDDGSVVSSLKCKPQLELSQGGNQIVRCIGAYPERIILADFEVIGNSTIKPLGQKEHYQTYKNMDIQEFHFSLSISSPGFLAYGSRLIEDLPESQSYDQTLVGYYNRTSSGGTGFISGALTPSSFKQYFLPQSLTFHLTGPVMNGEYEDTLYFFREKRSCLIFKLARPIMFGRKLSKKAIEEGMILLITTESGVDQKLNISTGIWDGPDDKKKPDDKPTPKKEEHTLAVIPLIGALLVLIMIVGLAMKAFRSSSGRGQDADVPTPGVYKSMMEKSIDSSQQKDDNEL
jgi:hypothetical protein